MSKLKNGSVDSSQTIKAGCGIRYDPDQLNDNSGFDFSNAADMKPEELEHELPTTKSDSDR